VITAIGAPISKPIIGNWTPSRAWLAAPDAPKPARKRSESPGKRIPTSKPVSVNKIARTPIKPKVEINVSGWRELIRDSMD
jgi:hypothetical protein